MVELFFIFCLVSQCFPGKKIPDNIFSQPETKFAVVYFVFLVTWLAKNWFRDVPGKHCAQGKKLDHNEIRNYVLYFQKQICAFLLLLSFFFLFFFNSHFSLLQSVYFFYTFFFFTFQSAYSIALSYLFFYYYSSRLFSLKLL